MFGTGLCGVGNSLKDVCQRVKPQLLKHGLLLCNYTLCALARFMDAKLILRMEPIE